jgi:hypothetical protein
MLKRGLGMAKYKSAKPNEKNIEKKAVSPNTKANQRKSHIMRIAAIVFALMLLLSMAIIFPLQHSFY